MTESMYWVDVDGGCLKIHDADVGVSSATQNYFVLGGVEGRWMPKFDINTDRTYSYDGEVVRNVQTKGRNIVIPILVKGSTSQEWLYNIRTLLHAMAPQRGDGALKVYTADNPVKTRMIKCRLQEAPIVENYETGIYNACTVGSSTPTQWRMFPVTFYASDPYWYDPNENDVYIDGTHRTYPFVLYNSGDVNAWPIWCVSGPNGTTFSIDNKTTGKSMDVTLTLATGSLYIDTRPLLRSCLLNHITNEESALNTTSTRFPLVPGANTIALTFQAATTYCSVRCRWVDKYGGV